MTHCSTIFLPHEFDLKHWKALSIIARDVDIAHFKNAILNMALCCLRGILKSSFVKTPCTIVKTLFSMYFFQVPTVL